MSSPVLKWFMDLSEEHKVAVNISSRNALSAMLQGETNWFLKPDEDGVFYIRVPNPAYRIYCVRDGNRLIALLAGDKRRQGEDIQKARRMAREFNKEV